MSDHLPECIYGTPSVRTEDCIFCSSLRACEQRVNDEWVRDYGGHRAFALGVQAAREAVAAIEHWASYNTTDDATYQTYAGDPLAAIDALKEGTDG